MLLFVAHAVYTNTTIQTKTLEYFVNLLVFFLILFFVSFIWKLSVLLKTMNFNTQRKKSRKKSQHNLYTYSISTVLCTQKQRILFQFMFIENSPKQNVSSYTMMTHRQYLSKQEKEEKKTTTTNTIKFIAKCACCSPLVYIYSILLVSRLLNKI